MRKYIIFWLIVFFLVAFDQYTKHLVLANFRLHESMEIIPGLLSIVLVKNSGAAFGFLSSLSPMWRALFLGGATLLAFVFIIYLLVTMTDEHRKIVLPALSLFFAGAVGNTIDRLRLGEVVDFIDCHIGALHWPAFNIADGAITISAFLLALWLFRSGKRTPRS